MNKTKILEGIGHVLSYSPQKMLRSLEIVAQVAQGKGGGGDSVLREVRTIVKLANKLGLDELNVVDCGANVGTWSIALARAFPRATIIALEPSKFAFELLKVNTIGIPSISIENLAAGKISHHAKLMGKEPGWGGASLIARNSLKMDLGFSEDVTVVDLDTFFSTRVLPHPNVLKIDTEGSELDVLLGATSILENLHIIQFEFASSNIDSRNYFLDYFNLLTDAGFTLARMTPRGLQDLIRYDAREEIFATSNFVAYKK
jgi:FkbM family methyltransferase